MLRLSGSSFPFSFRYFQWQKVAQRFEKSKRLLKQNDFKVVFDRGERYSSAYFTVVGCLTEHGDGATSKVGPTIRMGLVVSKKVGNAAQRNRVKRLLREVFRLNYKKLSEFGEMDIAVIAKPAIKDRFWPEVVKANHKSKTSTDIQPKVKLKTVKLTLKFVENELLFLYKKLAQKVSLKYSLKAHNRS